MHEKVFEFAVMKVMKGEKLNAEERNTVAKLSKAHTVPDDAMSNDSSEECNKNSDGAEFSSEQQQNYADLIQKRNIHRKCAVQSINLLIDTYVGC